MAIITTIHGDMDESLLVKLEGGEEDDEHKLDWVEYRLPGSDEIVHRSVNLHIKKVPWQSAADVAPLS